MSDEILIQKFMNARKVGTPIISITTFDQVATVQAIQTSIAGTGKSTPIIQWDSVKGWRSRNDEGKAAINLVVGDGPIEATRHAVKQLDMALGFPERTVLFIMNAHHRNHPSETNDFWQALCNVREDFKDNLRTVVLMSPQLKLPLELQQDVLLLDEKLPNTTQLEAIVTSMAEIADVKITDTDKEEAVKALRGIAAFPAEQTTAMGLTGGVLDITSLWDRKRSMISETPGLKVYSGTEKFGTLGGCLEIKEALTRVIQGKEEPRVIVFIDEGEKVFAGATGDVGDSTGVSQDFLGTMLSYMEDNEADGSIFVGPPGAAKSAIAKTMGNEAGIPTITMDLGGMKGSLLGESETRLRNALKIIDAVGDGRAYFIMTSNKIMSLPPELKRRFTSGTYFFDLPTFQEREIIWDIYIEKYSLDKKQVVNFDDTGWTGAEIRNCCRMAYRQNLTILEAARYIIPVSKSGARQLQALREQANGNYLSANYQGVYDLSLIQADKSSTLVVKVKSRRFDK